MAKDNPDTTLAWGCSPEGTKSLTVFPVRTISVEDIIHNAEVETVIRLRFNEDILLTLNIVPGLFAGETLDTLFNLLGGTSNG